jgi:predicted N-formylglutamate amidohydrolase
MNEMPESLLAVDEPAPVTVHNENGRSPFLIVADHAGNSMPRALRQLGVPEAEGERHMAWDIGIAGLCRVVADALDATLVQQNYSRLVIDCNRRPGSETSILEISELTPIPGNMGLSEGQKVARIREIFRPYHDRIETELDRRPGRPTHGVDRDAQLHARLQGRGAALACWRAIQSRSAFRPSPHGAAEARKRARSWRQRALRVTDASDYTIPVHGERRGLHHVAIEVRQDLIADGKGLRAWGLRLARLLGQAYQQLVAAEAIRPA